MKGASNLNIDFEISVDVHDLNYRDRKRVLEAFCSLGVGTTLSSEGVRKLLLSPSLKMFTNKERLGSLSNYLIWRDEVIGTPTHTPEQLFKLAGIKDMNKPILLPFDLEKALSGEPVVNGFGNEVVEIHLMKTELAKFPVVAVLLDRSNENRTHTDSFTCSGRHVFGDSNPKKNLYMKTKTRNINGFEVPAPLSEMPDIGTTYYIPLLDFDDFVSEVKAWNGDYYDLMVLMRGLVHTSPESAIANAKAIIGIDPYGDTD